MNQRLIKYLLPVLLTGLFGVYPLDAAPREVPASSRREIARVLTRITAREVIYGWVRVERIQSTRKCLRIYTSIGLSYYPFREANVRAMYDSVRHCLPAEFAHTPIEIYTDGQRIEELIPLGARSGAPKRPTVRFTQRNSHPLVKPQSRCVRPTQGLDGRHIALWQSHGRYFDQRENRWRWQRTLQWQTCEDLYTQSYVLPFLVPMLEKAGANVLLPRERDIQKIEYLIDNDPGIPSPGRYEEQSEREAWYDGGVGFAHRRYLYRAAENPFREGTVRRIRTVSNGAESHASWRVSIDQTGDYGVYVSYESLPESATDAQYTVHHAGGESRFSVNQRMGGGTWIYLGTFRFRRGDEAVVTLSNRSAHGGRIVTADAVKIGGGFGNVVRTVCDSLRTNPETVYREVASGYPRSCEGARYWLQWAGFDESVYSPKQQTDDYKDDYMCRALWVNALMGGSERLPDSVGLGIPIDLALGLHSDSGVRQRDDETVGTLGIFCTRDQKGHFAGGASRYRSRDLTDLVMTQIVEDVRRSFEPHWIRRGLWNRSYYEARVPCVPTALIEMMSHQNFADMQYGLDPRFRFLVSRAIYKGILKHVAAQYNQPYTVQPLPVAAFAVQLTDDGADLTWRPVVDTLEPTAAPDGYVVYTRIGDGGFDNGTFTTEPHLHVPLAPGVLHSYRVAAVNAGGESFTSETLVAYRAPKERGRLLVVNGFDRVSGPETIRNDSMVGFRNDRDSGVPYLYDIAYAGPQQIFDRASYRATGHDALGSCSDAFASDILGGNSFDYPYVHAEAAAAAGWSVASASVHAWERFDTLADHYDAVDLILGKQRSIETGTGMRGTEFQTFSPTLQQRIRYYVEECDGALFVSGCYVVSDLMTGLQASDEGSRFARDVLHCHSAGTQEARDGRITILPSEAGLFPHDTRFRTGPRGDFYAIEQSDCLLPADDRAFVVACRTDDRTPIGVAWRAAGDSGRTLVVGFPFEAIDDSLVRTRMMAEILRFLRPMDAPEVKTQDNL